MIPLGGSSSLHPCRLEAIATRAETHFPTAICEVFGTLDKVLPGPWRQRGLCGSSGGRRGAPGQSSLWVHSMCIH